MRVRNLVAAAAAACVMFALAHARAAAQEPPKYTYWILAEGAANAFFDEQILIGNPNAAPATVKITLLPEGGAPIVVPPFDVLPTSRYTFDVRSHLPGQQGRSVSAVVESPDNLPLVVERTMTWANGNRRAGHNSPGLLATSPIWYLAEGTTGFFDTFILIANPDPDHDAQVEVKYLREISGPITQTLTVPKSGRVTIAVNSGFDLNGDGENETFINEPFSTIVRSTNGVGLAVERAMYWNKFGGGHESTAVTAPNKTWLFAEGSTGGDASFSWETYLLLANPGSTPATVTLTFFRESGGPLVYQTTVAGNARKTLQIGSLDIDGDNRPDLPSASFSTRIESTQDIVAERAMYWSSNGITYIEGHNTPGVNAEALKWAFAEGAEGSVDASGINYDSFFLVSNATATPLVLQATFVREDGKGMVKTFNVPARSRFTLPTGTYPELSHQRFSAFLETRNDVPFVAERAVYWGVNFSGGHASVGTPWTATIGTPSEIVLTPAVTKITPNTGPVAGGTIVTITGTNFIEPLAGFDGTHVKFGNVDAKSVTVMNATTLVVTAPPSTLAGAVEVTVSNNHIDAAWPATTVPNGFTYTRSDPVLKTDRTLAFGDSITLGTSSQWCDMKGTPFVCSTLIAGYPERLRAILRQQYPAQASIDVTNAGVASECVARSGCTGVSGGRRLLDLLPGPQNLVVIMEGVNDANGDVPVPDVVAALRGMIRASRSQGKEVILATLTPVKPRENAPDDPPEMWKTNPFHIVDMNAGIEQLAVEEQVLRVNMFSAFGSGQGPLDCAASASCRALLSPDGLHPNAAGYQRMAEAIAGKIIDHFELR